MELLKPMVLILLAGRQREDTLCTDQSQLEGERVALSMQSYFCTE